jgi:serine-type D-Ala-D-Ala carboxypeptidase (penicillin-binding protein 5/6)
MKNDTLKNRRAMIILQLLLLLVVLSGLFSAYILHPRQTATVQEAIDIGSVPVNEPNQETLDKIAEVTVRAKAAYVWDINSQTVLYEKNADDPLPLASITKLMTALLAYELASLDERTGMSESALAQDGSNGFTAGERFNLESLGRLALVTSSNDAAYQLGASVGALLGERDANAQFVEAMNIRAEELELKTLTFKNTTGLDINTTTPGAVGSAKDVSLLMEHVLKTEPELLEATTRGGARIYNSNGNYYDIENTNEVLYAIPNLLGSKTGYTDLAGGNLTIVFDAGLNRPVVVTVLGSSRDERFSDVLRLVRATQSHISNL